MSLERLVLALTVTVVAIPSAHAGDTLQFGPPPAWIETAGQPGTADVKSADGLPARIVLSDSQVRFEPGQQSTYSATTIKFQTAQGLQGGNINLVWRPETDQVTVHKVAIRRGDQIIDVLAGGQTFSILRREQNLDAAMLDGVLTATLFPEGLQIGDVLEIASTVVSRDPVLAGHGELAVGPLNIPVDRANIRVQWPSGRSIKLAKTADLPEWKRGRAGGWETASLSLTGLEPLPVPRLAPVRYGLVRFIEASDYPTWGNVAALNLPLYAKAARIPPQGPLRTEVDAIRTASADPVARAEAALKLVQGRIRYVALAMGQGGLVPADAEQTWARRFGDCKAKTALLLAILGELGIEAEAVAVHSGLGDAVARRLPAVGAFDHIVVRARIAGREYWLDGTRQGDSSLARLPIPNYGWGLPIKPGAELVRIVPGALAQPQSDLAIRMDASKDVHAPVPTEIELTFRGDEAIALNLALASVVGDARDRALREIWRRRFDFVEPDSVSVSFDETSGELRMGLKGKAKLEWDDGWYLTDETGVGFKADFSRQAGPGIDAPYLVGHPFYTRTRQTILLPAGFAPPTGKDQNVAETVAGVEYRRSTRFADNSVTIEASQRSVAPEFAAKDAPAFQARLRELWDNAVYLQLPVTQRAAGGTKLGPKEEAEALVVEGAALLEAGKIDEAVTRFTRVTELDPSNSYGWANRGVSLLHKGSLDEAAVDLGRANALDPKNPVVFRGRGLLAEARGDRVGAVAEFTKALEFDPKSAFALMHRATNYFAQNKPLLALADADRALEISPRTYAAHGLRVAVHLAGQRRADALKAVDALVVAAGEDSVGLALASDMYSKLGERDRAKALVERATAHQPSAQALFIRSRSRDESDLSGRLADLDESVKLAPRAMAPLIERAKLKAQASDADGALADLAKTFELGTAPRDIYVLAADLARRNGQAERAVTIAASLVTAHPDSLAALVDAAKIYASLGKHAEAVAAVDRAIATSPYPYLYLDRSRVREPGDYATRLADIDQALRLSPKFGDALLARAELLTEKGDHAEAIRTYTRTMATDMNPLIMGKRGISHARLGQISQAERDFTEARRRATNPSTLSELCYSKAVANIALERALAECEAASRMAPALASIMDKRGAVLLRLGRLDEAIRAFDKALATEPSPNTRYLRAVARARKGDAPGAVADLAMAQVQAPGLSATMERNGFVVTATPTTAAAN